MRMLLEETTAAQLQRLLARSEVGPVEVVSGYLDRIDRLNPRLGAYITVCHDLAIKAAQRAERLPAQHRKGLPLFGIPFAVKDQFLTRSVRTTAGSRILEGFVPDSDATAVARLTSAGAILLGKLNMTAFAAGMDDKYPFLEPRNPWDESRTPGGSSGGSAIAVAASMCAFSLGEDTGGSIRSPASFNGIVGLRPTWSLVSKHGLLPFSWSMDTAGPMTSTVEDVAMVMSVIAGHDPSDPLSSTRPVPDYSAALGVSVQGMKAAVVDEWMDPQSTDPEVRSAIDRATIELGDLGVTVERISWPYAKDAATVLSAVSESDGAFVHSEGLRSRPLDYGPNIRRRLLAAALLPGHHLEKAIRMRAVIRSAWLDLFDKFDVLLSPTTDRPAEPISYIEAITSRDEVERKFGRSANARVPAALAGSPACSIPCGFTSGGLPIGLQVMAPPFREDVVIAIGSAYERATSWHQRRPDLPN